MTNVERPIDIGAISAEMLEPFKDVIFDRDGTLGHFGQRIDPSTALHVNRLIEDNPEKRFTIITNGSSDTSPINADVIRTPMPFIKQFRPRLLKNYVEEPDRSILITDSFSETTLVRILGFHVYYLEEKLTPHPYEQFLRNITKPLRAPVAKLIGV